MACWNKIDKVYPSLKNEKKERTKVADLIVNLRKHAGSLSIKDRNRCINSHARHYAKILLEKS